MRTIIQFGDVLLVISICLGRAPSHNTINHKLMPFPQQIASTIIRPCLRQFSFKFCDHRSPLPHPSFFSRNRTSLACTPAGIQCKILQLQKYISTQAKPCTSTSTPPRYCNKHSMFVERGCKSLPCLTTKRLKPAWLRSREL